MRHQSGDICSARASSSSSSDSDLYYHHHTTTTITVPYSPSLHELVLARRAADEHCLGFLLLEAQGAFQGPAIKPLLIL